MSKARGFVFTLNNPTDEDGEALEKIECRYLVIGRETGESGTFHYQGYILFKNPRSFEAVKKLIPRAHIEVQKGSYSQAIEYCKKDGDFIERGDCPDQGSAGGDANKRRFEDAFAAAARGEFEAIPGDIKLRFWRTIKEIRKDHMEVPADEADVTGVWIYGPPGCGKSHSARERFPGAYLKMQNKWWDGYQEQEYVILDDFDSKELGHHLKIWADRYAFLAETKGGALAIRPKKIVITSNYAPDDSKFGWDSEMVEAIKRRFKIEHMSRYDPMAKKFM